MSWVKKYWVYFAIAISIGAFLLFRNFLNDNSQALMVLITAIYVIATINISNANIKSAEATREQITESKRQFEETKRLEYMPCFEIHFDDMDAGTGICIDLTDKKTGVIHTLFTKYRIENISKGTAVNVKCVIKSSIKTNELGICPIVPAQKEKSINCIIAADKGYFLENSLPFSIAIQYNDIMKNLYEQDIELEFLEDKPRRIWVKNIGAPQLKNKGE